MDNELSFFASANSGQGFVSFFEDIFSGLKRNYIIKGGPGTGKSSLMKNAARAAEDKGMTVERFYCSSDPDSLDGIIIQELSTGITDGTAPHTRDPKYPGAADDIIDLGAFWDKRALTKSRAYIKETVDRKAQLYRDTYSCLNAALTLDRIIKRRLSQVVEGDTLNSLARTYINDIPYVSGKQSIRLTDAISAKGHCRLLPYTKQAERIYNIKDSYGIASLFMNGLSQALYGRGMVISYEALNTDNVNMIYLPQGRILFCVNADMGEKIDLDALFSNEPDTESIKAHKNALLSEAYTLMMQASELHFSLEDIYISAMDFDAKEQYEKNLINEIFT